jgi:hypothetical protein
MQIGRMNGSCFPVRAEEGAVYAGLTVLPSGSII